MKVPEETLLRAVQELSANVKKLEVDALAVANVMIKKGLITKDELEVEARSILNMLNERVQLQMEQEVQQNLLNEMKNVVVRKRPGGHNIR